MKLGLCFVWLALLLMNSESKPMAGQGQVPYSININSDNCLLEDLILPDNPAYRENLYSDLVAIGRSVEYDFRKSLYLMIVAYYEFDGDLKLKSVMIRGLEDVYNPQEIQQRILELYEKQTESMQPLIDHAKAVNCISIASIDKLRFCT